MNVPILGKYGTSSASSLTHSGSFVGADIENANAGVAGTNNSYGNASAFDKTAGIVFQREAAGVVEAIGPQVQVTNGDVSVMYQGDIILGRMAMGADYLNPAACVELTVQNNNDTIAPANANDVAYTSQGEF
jgi:hypothetical protein